MSLDFGKGNRSIAFSPTSAFPLNANCYFESKNAAEQAAALAKEAGSTETIYYYGMQIVVVQGGIPTLYVIEKTVDGGGRLKKIGFEHDYDIDSKTLKLF